MNQCNAVLFRVRNWTIKNATGFSFIQIHRTDAASHVNNLQILWSAKCSDLLYPSGISANFLKSQFQSPFTLSACNPETFSFSTATSAVSTWLQIPFWQIYLQSHIANDQCGDVCYLLALVEIWWSVSHVTSLCASLKVANPPNCIKLSKHKHIYQNLSLRKSKTGGKL